MKTQSSVQKESGRDVGGGLGGLGSKAKVVWASKVVEALPLRTLP